MMLYAVGTAACSVAPNIWVLVACRIVSALGIGGEWAAGAAMVAEVVPENRRVEAGALLYTASPVGLFLATFVTYQITGVYFTDPATSWRYVFLCGLIPAAAALAVRMFIKEPERWKKTTAAQRAKISELFSPKYRALTISGFCMAVTALITWWSCNAFISVVAKGLCTGRVDKTHRCRNSRSSVDGGHGSAMGQDRNEHIQSWRTDRDITDDTGGKDPWTSKNVPGLFRRFGGRFDGRIWFGSRTAHAVCTCTFRSDLTTYGIFGAFTFYLPELFPTRLRGTGSGFTYNIGRLFAAVGPFIVGSVAASGADSLWAGR